MGYLVAVCSFAVTAVGTLTIKYFLSLLQRLGGTGGKWQRPCLAAGSVKTAVGYQLLLVSQRLHEIIEGGRNGRFAL